MLLILKTFLTASTFLVAGAQLLLALMKPMFVLICLTTRAAKFLARGAQCTLEIGHLLLDLVQLCQYTFLFLAFAQLAALFVQMSDGRFQLANFLFLVFVGVASPADRVWPAGIYAARLVQQKSYPRRKLARRADHHFQHRRKNVSVIGEPHQVIRLAATDADDADLHQPFHRNLRQPMRSFLHLGPQHELCRSLITLTYLLPGSFILEP
uniref:Uncharacterized protein n=1 Tax=Anopheles culicifacies TaxID=139723 RepID=A0A182LZM7_9DIPT